VRDVVNAVSICSNALLMLGAHPINDFNDAAQLSRAVLCSNLYPHMRDKLIRSHPWNCCIKRALLAPDAVPPPFGYEQQFELPADFLRVLEARERGELIDYLLEGRSILADTVSLELRYVFRNVNEETWDSGLVELATLEMAALLAYPITQSASVRDSMKQDLIMATKVARAVDGQEDPAQTLGDEHLLGARFGGFR
jgi:hypothetical protein